MIQNPYEPPRCSSPNSQQLSSGIVYVAKIALSLHVVILIFIAVMNWVVWIEPNRGKQILIAMIGIFFHAYFIFNNRRKVEILLARHWTIYAVLSMVLLFGTMFMATQLMEIDESHPEYLRLRELDRSAGS